MATASDIKQPPIERQVKASSLTKEQQSFIDSALAGNSLLLTGNGGSGKTYAMQRLANQFHQHGRLALVRHSLEDIVRNEPPSIARSLARKPPRHESMAHLFDRFAANREMRGDWTSAQVVIIDDVDIAPTTVARIHESLCVVRRSTAPFGGMQVILAAVRDSGLSYETLSPKVNITLVSVT